MSVPLRYVELVRVSTQGQADRDTPEAQRAALLRLRLARPGSLVEAIEFVGSGAKDMADRPDLQRLTVLANKRAFDEVRVFRLDRLTRHDNPAERFAVYSLVAEAGAVFVDASGRVTDPKTELGELDYYFQTMMAARERQRIKERTQAGKRRLAALGHLVQGDPPYARTFDTETGAWGIDPKRAGIYKMIVKQCLAGRSLQQIAGALNDAGHVTSRGCAFSDKTVWKLLTAPAAYGLYKTQGFEFKIPAIVDEETFHAVQERLRSNNSLSGPRPKVLILLRKLAVCGACGSPLYAQLGGGTPARWRYYYCSSLDPACRVYHRVEDVDAKVIETLRAWLDEPDTLARAAGLDSADDTRQAAQRDIEGAQEASRRLDNRETNTARLLTQGDIQDKTARTLMAEIKKARSDIAVRLTEAQARLQAAGHREQVRRDLATVIEGLRKGLGAATPEDWRGLCEIVFPRGGVRVAPDGRITLRGRVSVATPLPKAPSASSSRPGIREPGALVGLPNPRPALGTR
jgi:site-specific DNA recombinase